LCDIAVVRTAAALVFAPAALAACARGPSEVSLTEADTQYCPSPVVEGIDVYSGNGAIDWTMVASSGREFAFIKATQGNYDQQSTFSTQWSGAHDAGLLRSPYHFFDGTIDGVTQANWFMSELTSVGGLKPGDLPPMLDLECPTSSVESQAQSGCEYAGDSGWVATATLQQRALDWLSTVQHATGLKPIIYSYPSWFAATGVTSTALTAYPLYIATYAGCADVPAPWTTATFWQYSATATVPGVTGEVDVDRFFGSDGDLEQLTLPSVPTDGGVDAPNAVDTDAGSRLHAGGGCHCAAGDTRASDVMLPVALALMLGRRRSRRSV
jgi:GH25 family lysozyme M1 (1,4-beta-N-acetylmuramidase)